MIFLRRPGLSAKWLPHRRLVSRRRAGTAFPRYQSFVLRAPGPRPEGQRRGREPSKDGAAPRGSEGRHVRRGRNMSGEYHNDEDLWQPHPHLFREGCTGR